MRYEIRTEKNGTPIVLTGNAPDYEASFDTTSVRDGLIYHKVYPLDANGNVIDIKAAPYNAPGRDYPFHGVMVNNHLDVSKPLIMIGAPLLPASEPFQGWTANALKDNLIFSYNLMEHLRARGSIPEFCFTDATTVTIDPSNPLSDSPSMLADLMGDTLTGTTNYNPGDACLQYPFFEIAAPNGILDIYENTAYGYIKDIVALQAEYLSATPAVIDFYGEIVTRLNNAYQQTGDWYSTFLFKEPVRYGDPKNLLKEKLKERIISNGITSVLIFGTYHRSTDGEISTGTWPEFQEAVDEINQELGKSIRIGAIADNDYQLLYYDNFLRSQYLILRELVKSYDVPSGMKVGLMGAGHGGSESSRLYDAGWVYNPVMIQRIQDYINARLTTIYPTGTPFLICQSSYANSPLDGIKGVGEQVYDWVNEGYDYIFVYPMEWAWSNTETWKELRQYAMELVDAGNTVIYSRDLKGRSELLINGKTHLVIGETILDQKPYNGAAYHYFLASNTQLLEERMINLTKGAQPIALSGTITISSKKDKGINLSLPFSDTLLAQGSKITMQDTGVRATGMIKKGSIKGDLNSEDLSYYLYALLAENFFNVGSVAVQKGSINLQMENKKWKGNVDASATVEIAGEEIELKVAIKIKN
jgi:hypothetical protein